jgi:hypothetical protein
VILALAVSERHDHRAFCGTDVARARGMVAR